MKSEIENIINLIGSNKLRISDINEYVQKLLTNATIIPYIEEGKILGFISYYSNDLHKKNAFLTLIAIHPDFQGIGLGKKLLFFSISDLKQKGFKNYHLEVLKNNGKAIELYKKCGFKIIEDKNSIWLMSIEI